MTIKGPSFDHLAYPIGLGFVAGFIDLFGFMQWYGLLTAHATGNLIFLAYDVVRGQYELVTKAGILPLFALWVALDTWFIDALIARGRQPFVPTILLQAAALGACLFSGMALPPPQGPDDIGVVVPGAMALLAMATQNTMMRLVLNNLPPTTVMTGNITQVVADAVRQAANRNAEGLPRRVVLVASTLSGFTLGAIAGGLMQAHLGYPGLLLPILVLLSLLLTPVRA